MTETKKPAPTPPTVTVDATGKGEKAHEELQPQKPIVKPPSKDA